MMSIIEVRYRQFSYLAGKLKQNHQISKTTNNINKNNEIKTNTIEDGKDDKHNSYESIPPAPPAPPLAVMPPAIISRLYQISARLSIKLNNSILANDDSKIRKRRGCSVIAYH